MVRTIQTRKLIACEYSHLSSLLAACLGNVSHCPNQRGTRTDCYIRGVFLPVVKSIVGAFQRLYVVFEELIVLSL